MEIIKEFLYDSTATNLNVIITAVISTIVTAVLINLSKTIWEKFKEICTKTVNYIKNKFRELKSFINCQKIYKRICKEYKRDKSSYTLNTETQLMFINKHLTKKQRKVAKMIKKENEDTVGREAKEIVDRMREIVDSNQNYFRTRL